MFVHSWKLNGRVYLVCCTRSTPIRVSSHKSSSLPGRMLEKDYGSGSGSVEVYSTVRILPYRQGPQSPNLIRVIRPSTWRVRKMGRMISNG